MAKERNDYKGPLEERVHYEEFSKEFLLKLMRLWQEAWYTMTEKLLEIGAGTEGIGMAKAVELELRILEAVNPPVFAKIAELAKVDKNTIEGRIKAGSLSMDNIYENYPPKWEIKSDKEAILTYYRCKIAEQGTAGGNTLEGLRQICHMEPRFAQTMQNYPGARKVKVTMLKVPESLTKKPDEPWCIWKFALGD